MPLLQPNFDPSRKDLRWFAALWWPAICGLTGLMVFRKFHAPVPATWIWIGGGVLAVLGVIRPPAIRIIYMPLIRLTYPIGWCVSHVVLAALYFLVLTPAGFLVRLFHDPMERRFERESGSYWVARTESENSRYFRQL